MCQYLVNDLHICVDVVSTDNTSPFHYAVFHAQIDTINWFFREANADIHLKNHHGCNASQW